MFFLLSLFWLGILLFEFSSKISFFSFEFSDKSPVLVGLSEELLISFDSRLIADSI